MRRIPALPLHPILLAAWFVLSLQIETGVYLLASARVWGIALALAVLLLLLWRLVTGSWHVGGWAATASLWLLATPSLERIWMSVLIVLCAVGAVFLVRRIRHGQLAGADITRGLNAVTAALIIVTLAQGVATGVVGAWADQIGSREPAGGNPVAGLPDIYFIWLDGYPRADVLESVSGMDNTAFLTGLEDRGFSVIDDSHSSYFYSDLTAISLFSGRHLVDIEALAPLRSAENRPALARQTLNTAPLVERLRELGYVTAANAQAWDESGLRAVDVYIEGEGWNEFEREVWWRSLPGSIWEARGPVVYQDVIEPWVHDGFEAIGRIAEMDLEEPRFAFVHVPSPHLPIIFGPDGERVDPVFGLAHPGQMWVDDEAIRTAYAGQIAYLNDRLLETLDAAPIPDDAIVVLMSDHGPEFGLSWSSGERTDAWVRFGAFLAIRGPAEVTEATTNVSGTLSAILAWLGQDAEPFEDRLFTTDAYDKFVTLSEVPSPYR